MHTVSYGTVWIALQIDFVILRHIIVITAITVLCIDRYERIFTQSPSHRFKRDIVSKWERNDRQTMWNKRVRSEMGEGDEKRKYDEDDSKKCLRNVRHSQDESPFTWCAARVKINAQRFHLSSCNVKSWGNFYPAERNAGVTHWHHHGKFARRHQFNRFNFVFIHRDSSHDAHPHNLVYLNWFTFRFYFYQPIYWIWKKKKDKKIWRITRFIYHWNDDKSDANNERKKNTDSRISTDGTYILQRVMNCVHIVCVRWQHWRCGSLSDLNKSADKNHLPQPINLPFIFTARFDVRCFYYIFFFFLFKYMYAFSFCFFICLTP